MPDHQTTDRPHRTPDPTSGGSDAVVAVVPVWNRPDDVAQILSDLAAQNADAPLAVIVVDNASDVPVDRSPAVQKAVQASAGSIAVRFLRLDTNLGGSGGYNAGMRAAIGEHAAFVWLVDSDARVEPGCLAALLAVARRQPVAAVGSAIGDPVTGLLYEVGATIDPKTAALTPCKPMDRRETEVDYASACCLLVPAASLHAAGLLPDLFLRTDDVAFGIRLRRATGLPIIATVAARCRHPKPGRFTTWPRYYDARNWVVYAADAGLGARARFRRGFREVFLAAGQTLVGRDDLARLHARGLADAADGSVVGKAAEGRTETQHIWPISGLHRAIDAVAPTFPNTARPLAAIHTDAALNENERASVTALLEKQDLAVAVVHPKPRSLGQAVLGLLRLVITPPAVVAVVSANAPPHAWCAGRIIIAVSDAGYTITRIRVFERLAALTGTVARGMVATLRITLRPPPVPTSPPADLPTPADVPPTLSVVVLARDRRDKVLHTLGHLLADPAAQDAEIIVVDNASSDSTPDAVRNRFPDVTVLETGANLGVEGFNKGVAASSGEAVLILDDDAWPSKGALAGVLETLRTRPEVSAVMLHPRHPKTNEWEWPGERAIDDPGRWPIMGSGNLVRRAAWNAVGGYEAGYFLYRNDTDLALKLLAAGREVVFSHEHFVWHDSPLAASKSARWHSLATRNWIWMSKRHGRGGTGLASIVFGWAWAHRLAGLSPAKHLATLRGALAGLLRRAPKLEPSVRPDGHPLRRLLRLKRRLRG